MDYLAVFIIVIMIYLLGVVWLNQLRYIRFLELRVKAIDGKGDIKEEYLFNIYKIWKEANN